MPGRRLSSPKGALPRPFSSAPRVRRLALGTPVCLLLSSALLAACGERGDPAPHLLESDSPIHLEAHLAAAAVESSGPAPVAGEGSRSWSFPADADRWQASGPASTPPVVTPTGDALQLRLDGPPGVRTSASLATSLPDWRVDDWGWVVVKVRASGAPRLLGLQLNRSGEAGDGRTRWQLRGDEVPLLGDGEVHSYRLRVDLRQAMLQGPWRDLGLHVTVDGPSTVEVLGVEAVPISARYAGEGVGTELVSRGGSSYRRALFVHAPARLRYRLRVPPAGRLDVGLGVLDPSAPVSFRVVAAAASGDERVLLDATRADPEGWDQRSVDLSPWAERELVLTLEADAERAGTVALWAEPIVSGRRPARRPNVLLYLIDGAGAELTSLHGNPRPTTPFLDELAELGVVFERAHSNSSWTKPATSTLLTSLHHSLLGGTRTLADPLPADARTLPEILHDAGYLTAGFTSNPFVGRVSDLDRGLDRLRDADRGSNSVSSVALHEALRRWRGEVPGTPFYAHVQTTDVHSPHRPEGETAGRFLDPAERRRFTRELQRLAAAGGTAPDSPAWVATGIDRDAFYEAQRRLFEECLAHNDARFAELVRFLRETGEWENTLTIVTADHGVRAAGLHLPGAITSERVLASSFETGIPLVVIWPGAIPAGRRIREPVSLIDLPPTILDLVGLPALPSARGRSLAGLLRGDGGEGDEPAPVILEEVEVDPRSGELRGLLEVIDGRWAASLLIGDGPPRSGNAAPPAPRTAPFLLFDLEADPYALDSVHREHPREARRYYEMLRDLAAEHREHLLSHRPADSAELTSDQLETLRSLGYLE